MSNQDRSPLTALPVRKGPWRTIRGVAVAGMIGLLACACSSHVRVVKVTDRPIEDSGVYYALPMTEVVTEITVEAVDKKPGKFQDWAEAIFGIKPPVTKKSRSVTVKPGSKITTQGRPDPSEVYMLEVKGKWYENRTISLGLDSWGAVQKLDQSTTDTRSDIAVSVIKTVLGFAGLPSFSQQSVETFESDILPMLQERGIEFISATMSSNAPSLVIGCSEMQADLAALLLDVRKETKIGVVTYLNRQPTKVCDVFKADQLIEPEKERKFPGVVKTLVEIIELRSIRSRLLGGVVVQASLSSDLVTTIGALDGRIDKTLGSSFMGTVSKESWTGSVPVVPEFSDTETTVPLLIVDPEEGVCAVAGAEPRTLVQLGVPKKFHADSCGDYPISLVLNERKGTVVQTIENAIANLEEGKDHGFVYRLPGRVDVTVQWTKPVDGGGCETEDLAADTLLIAQYGPVLTLPTSAGGKKTAYDITMYPETGALKSFVLGSEPTISAENVTAVGDALLAKEKAEREQDDQLARLTREKDILKAMKEIEALREELGAEEGDSGE